MSRCAIPTVAFAAVIWSAAGTQAGHTVTRNGAEMAAAVAWQDAAYRPSQTADIQLVGHGGHYYRPHHNYPRGPRGGMHHRGPSHYYPRQHGYYVPGRYHPVYPYVDLHGPYDGYYPGYSQSGGIEIRGPRASLWIGF